MAKNIICYSLGNIEPKKRLKFNQELYGYTDRSNHGNYKYQRKGILTNTNYEKPLDSTVLIPEEVLKSTIKHLKKYKAKYIHHKIKD